MEKFGRYRDPGTGIHPFVPLKPPPVSGTLACWFFLKKYFLGALLAIVRLCLLALPCGIYAVFGVFSWMIPVPVLSRWVDRIGTCASSRLALLLLGFWWIPSTTVTLSKKNTKLHQASKSHPLSNLNSTLQDGDVILANHTSYVDILYLAFRYSPVFVSLPNDWCEEVDDDILKLSESFSMVPLTLFPALKSCFFPSIQSTGQSQSSLVDLIHLARQKKLGPIVIFPEGTTSNGKSLLQFLPFLADPKQPENTIPLHKITFQIVGLKYPFQQFSPAFTCGSLFSHLFQLCSQFYNVCNVYYLALEDHLIASDYMDSKSNDKSTTYDLNRWVEDSSKTLANLLRVRKCRLTCKDKRKFLDEWNQVHSGVKYSKRK